MKTLVRLRAWSPVVNRHFAGLPPDHPLVGTPCPACDKPFAVGEETTLVALGPGDDESERLKAQGGGWYNAVAVALHWLCAGGKP